MTYEFAKHIADNLRFGSYTNKQIQFESFQNVRIYDVNSNTYVTFHTSNVMDWEEIEKMWIFKKEWKERERGILVNVYTGTLQPENGKTSSAFTINFDHVDYKFWKEFQTFIEAAYNDMIYKHNCLIEEVFVL